MIVPAIVVALVTVALVLGLAVASRHFRRRSSDEFVRNPGSSDRDKFLRWAHLLRDVAVAVGVVGLLVSGLMFFAAPL